MKKRLSPILFRIKCIFILTGSINCLNAQFESTIWSNQYSNHSVSSRDNVFFVNLTKNKDLLITGRVEDDFTNFDITNFVIDSNSDLLWKNSYSSKTQDSSDDHPSDVAIDSTGNIFVVGFRAYYINSSVFEYCPMLYKLDSDGNFLWSFHFDEFAFFDLSFQAFFLDVECDSTGNCYLLAEGWQPGLVPNARTFIFKFDQNGEIIWCKKTQLYKAEKLILDNEQNIFVINNQDENQNRKNIIQKYNKSGELLSEHRYYSDYVDLFDAKIDKKNSLWTFSNLSSSGFVDKKTCDILITHYNNEGSVIEQKIYDSQYHDYEYLKQVSFYNDSTFILGLDCNTPENGIDNLLILLDNKLHVVDSFRYDSDWNDNDYLISFDLIDKSNIIITGLSFIDNTNFVPYVYRIEALKDIKWISIPSIANNIATYPKKVYSVSSGRIFLIGDVQKTINPKLGFDTHSNIFITEFDTEGNEFLTQEFGEPGKSNIVGIKAQTDKQNNIYVSGMDQYGPHILYPSRYYNEDIILQKYSGDGMLQWNKKIEIPKTELEYLTHYITGDSLLTVVGSYQFQTDGCTVLYNFDTSGNLLDSAKYNRKVLSTETDNKGFFYLFFIEDQTIKIHKYNTDLEIVKSTSVPRNDCYKFITTFKNGNIYIACYDIKYLYKMDLDLNINNQISFSSYLDKFSSFTVDESNNLYIGGRRNSGILIKLNPSGVFLWNCIVNNLYSVNKGIEIAHSGDILLFGAERSDGGSIPNGIVQVSQNGAIKKYVSCACSIFKYLVDENDLIYIFSNINWVGSQNLYQKYSPNLDLLIDDHFNKYKAFGYAFDFNDVQFDSDNNLLLTGTIGQYMDQINGMFSWYTLALAKVGKVNCQPFFIDKNIKKKVLPGETITFVSTAIDYDNDSINYIIETPYNWIESFETLGTFILSPTMSDTGHYNIIISASDKYGGIDSNLISIQIGNTPPKFTSIPVTTAKLNNRYKYNLAAYDLDDEIIHYKLIEGPDWLNIDSSGSLFGIPTQKLDTGLFQVKVICYDDYLGEDTQIFSLQVETEKPTGIDGIDNEDILSIYPIPANSFINLKLRPESNKNIEIKIIKFNGSLVRYFPENEINFSDRILLDISGIMPGVYLLVISHGVETISRKVIIQ